MRQSFHNLNLKPKKFEKTCEDRFVISISYFDHWILISWYMNFANFVVLLMIWLMCFWIDFIDDYKFASWILSIVAKIWLLEMPSHCVMAKYYIITFNCVFLKGIWSFMKMWKFCGPLWERLCFEPKLGTLVP
jgi:hypothetical protein